MSCQPCQERQAALLQWANAHSKLLLLALAAIATLTILTHRRP